MKPIEQWMRDNHIKENEPFKLLLWGEEKKFVIKQNKIKPNQLVLRSYFGRQPSDKNYLELVGYILISNGMAPIKVLKPCPFCGKNDDVHVEHDKDHDYFSVRCRSCSVETTPCPNKNFSFRIWNSWKRSQEK